MPIRGIPKTVRIAEPNRICYPNRPDCIPTIQFNLNQVIYTLMFCLYFCFLHYNYIKYATLYPADLRAAWYQLIKTYCRTFCFRVADGLGICRRATNVRAYSTAKRSRCCWDCRDFTVHQVCSLTLDSITFPPLGHYSDLFGWWGDLGVVLTSFWTCL